MFHIDIGNLAVIYISILVCIGHNPKHIMFTQKTLTRINKKKYSIKN